MHKPVALREFLLPSLSPGLLPSTDKTCSSCSGCGTRNPKLCGVHKHLSHPLVLWVTGMDRPQQAASAASWCRGLSRRHPRSVLGSAAGGGCQLRKFPSWWAFPSGTFHVRLWADWCCPTAHGRPPHREHHKAEREGCGGHGAQKPPSVPCVAFAWQGISSPMQVHRQEGPHMLPEQSKVLEESLAWKKWQGHFWKIQRATRRWGLVCRSL